MSEHESGLVHDDAAGKRALHGSGNHHDGEHLTNGGEDSRLLRQNVKKGLPNSYRRRYEPKMKEHKSQIVDEICGYERERTRNEGAVLLQV